MRERIERISEKTGTRPRVCYICSHNPLCTGQRSCAVNKLIETAGGIDIMSDAGVDNVDDLLEAVFEKNPQVIIVAKEPEKTVDLFLRVKSDPRFQRTDAYLNGRIYQIDAELVCRPGPRAVEGLEKLAEYIYP